MNVRHSHSNLDQCDLHWTPFHHPCMAVGLKDTAHQTSFSLSVVLQLRQQHTAGPCLRDPGACRRNRRCTTARVQLLRDRCDSFSEARWPTRRCARCRPLAATLFQPLLLLLLPVVLSFHPPLILSACHRARRQCGPCARAPPMQPLPRGELRTTVTSRAPILHLNATS